MNRPPLGVAELLGVTVTAGGQGLELAESPGLSLEEQTARPRHLERQEGTGAAEVDQVQPIRPQARRQGQIEGIKIGRAIAPDSEIHVAPGSQPPLDRRTEQDEELEFRQRPGNISEALDNKFLRDGRLHAATLSEPSGGVKEELAARRSR